MDKTWFKVAEGKGPFPVDMINYCGFLLVLTNPVYILINCRKRGVSALSTPLAILILILFAFCKIEHQEN